MTIPSLLYNDGTSRKIAPINVSDNLSASYNGSTGELAIGFSGLISGQQIGNEVYTLEADFLPTILVPINGVAADYGYQAAASFWSISYPPIVTNSSIIITTAFLLQVFSSGTVIFSYTSNVEGAPPLPGSAAYATFPPAGATLDFLQNISSLTVVPNTTGAPITVYFCAYALSNQPTQRIYSSTSTETVFGGNVPSTASVVEVVS